METAVRHAASLVLPALLLSLVGAVPAAGEPVTVGYQLIYNP